MKSKRDTVMQKQKKRTSWKIATEKKQSYIHPSEAKSENTGTIFPTMMESKHILRNPTSGINLWKTCLCYRKE